MNTRWKSFAMGLALSAAAFTAQAAGALQFQPLHARDVPTLLQTPHARPLIVEIWSLECSYCRENIARIAQWRRTAKQTVDVVMVSMDGPDQAEMLNRALAPLAHDGRIGLPACRSTPMPKTCRSACAPRSTPAGRARCRARSSCAPTASATRRVGC